MNPICKGKDSIYSWSSGKIPFSSECTSQEIKSGLHLGWEAKTFWKTRQIQKAYPSYPATLKLQLFFPCLPNEM